MIKGFKVMLLPNNKQNTKMFQYAGTKRFAYNWTLARQQESYKNGGKFISDGDLRKEFTQLKKLDEFKWLNNILITLQSKPLKTLVSLICDFSKEKVSFLNLNLKRNLNPNSIKIMLKFNLLQLMLNSKDLLQVQRKINKNLIGLN